MEKKLRKGAAALVQAITDTPDHSASWMPALKALHAEPKTPRPSTCSVEVLFINS